MDRYIPYAEFANKDREGWSSGGEDSDGGEPYIGIFEKEIDQTGKCPQYAATVV